MDSQGITHALPELDSVPEWTEDDWRSLIRRIGDEKVGVIPVLGPDLVRVETPDGPVPLTFHFAQALAVRLDTPIPSVSDSAPLDAVAARYAAQGGKRTTFTEELCELVTQLALPTPEPLRQLAEIEHFALFVTTAFDPLLARALTNARGRAPRTLPYTRSEKPDLPADLPGLRRNGETVICQLLGEPGNSFGQWGVTEEERLEFHHALHAPTRQPHLLFSELQSKHLLMLGGGYPDWLGRFFLRNIRGQMLSERRTVEEFVVDPSILADAPLRRFLSRYSPQTRLHPDGNALGFISELHRRYLAKYPCRRVPAADMIPPSYRPPAGEPPKDAVFLSYAREDLAAARLLYTALCDAGAPAWFDMERLETGDMYAQKIFNAIDNAAFFVPVVSRAAFDRRPRFFRLEWAHAAERISMYAPGRPYVLPVFIDDLPPAEAPVNDQFLEQHIVQFPFLAESGAFVDPGAVQVWAETVREKLAETR